MLLRRVYYSSIIGQSVLVLINKIIIIIKKKFSGIYFFLLYRKRTKPWHKSIVLNRTVNFVNRYTPTIYISLTYLSTPLKQWLKQFECWETLLRRFEKLVYQFIVMHVWYLPKTSLCSVLLNEFFFIINVFLIKTFVSNSHYWDLIWCFTTA